LAVGDVAPEAVRELQFLEPLDKILVPTMDFGEITEVPDCQIQILQGAVAAVSRESGFSREQQAPVRDCPIPVCAVMMVKGLRELRPLLPCRWLTFFQFAQEPEGCVIRKRLRSLRESVPRGNQAQDHCED
jgi:hypothetical protein